MNVSLLSSGCIEQKIGIAALLQGKVGCIVLAGGDGSRLDWKGPKGTFPISLTGRTLFELMIEQTKAASSYFGHPLLVAVMTSPSNEGVTRQVLPPYIDTFCQAVAPLRDIEGNFLQEQRPNGNGETLKCFYQSGLYDKWARLGVEYVQIIFIDNPLAQLFDPYQIAAHIQKQADISLRVIEVKDLQNIGRIGKKEGKVCIIEYLDHPPQDWTLGNTGLFCFSMDFIKKYHAYDLPIHLVRKKVEDKEVWKEERFMFDLLQCTEKVELLLYPQEEVFAPLKTKSDKESVQKALLHKDRKAFFALTGQDPKEALFELDATFHYPTEKLRRKWQGKHLPTTQFPSTQFIAS